MVDVEEHKYNEEIIIIIIITTAMSSGSEREGLKLQCNKLLAAMQQLSEVQSLRESSIFSLI